MQFQSVVSRAGTPVCLPERSRVAIRRAAPLVCSARSTKDEEPSVMPKLAAVPLAAAIAAALLLGSATAPDAEAARSGGRVGGSVRCAEKGTLTERGFVRLDAGLGFHTRLRGGGRVAFFSKSV